MIKDEEKYPIRTETCELKSQLSEEQSKINRERRRKYVFLIFSYFFFANQCSHNRYRKATEASRRIFKATDNLLLRRAHMRTHPHTCAHITETLFYFIYLTSVEVRTTATGSTTEISRRICLWAKQ